MKQYQYPYGILAPTRPSDGQMHIIWDNKGSPKFIHRWNDLYEIWEDVTLNPAAPVKSNIIVKFNGHTVQVDGQAPAGYTFSIKGIIECQCGSDKIGSSMHSSWCDKYNTDI